MKKLILGLVLMFSLLSFGYGHAQVWTWSNPSPLNPPFLKEIAVNPVTGDIYGIDNAGVPVIPVGDGAEVIGLEHAPDISNPVVNDIAVTSTGILFICTQKEIQDASSVALAQQPKPPADLSTLDDPEDILQGEYTHIAVGQGGKLYVIYDVSGTQYLVIGTPPVTTEGVVVDVHPESLNLGSKGRWVTGIIDLPGEADESAITPGAVKISYITISDHGAVIAEDSADIPVAPGAPWSVELLDGKQVLKVKFPRYDKADPGNPQSLIGKLKDLLTTANAAAGRYQVTLTVDIPTSSGQFSGTDTIRIMLKHKMH